MVPGELLSLLDDVDGVPPVVAPKISNASLKPLLNQFVLDELGSASSNRLPIAVLANIPLEALSGSLTVCSTMSLSKKSLDSLLDNNPNNPNGDTFNIFLNIFKILLLLSVPSVSLSFLPDPRGIIDDALTSIPNPSLDILLISLPGNVVPSNLPRGLSISKLGSMDDF